MSYWASYLFYSKFKSTLYPRNVLNFAILLIISLRVEIVHDGCLKWHSFTNSSIPLKVMLLLLPLRWYASNNAPFKIMSENSKYLPVVALNIYLKYSKLQGTLWIAWDNIVLHIKWRFEVTFIEIKRLLLYWAAGSLLVLHLKIIWCLHVYISIEVVSA